MKKISVSIPLLLLVFTMPAFSDTLNVCFVSGSLEYESDASLSSFKTYLESNYDVECTLISADGLEDLPGLEALESCDAALFFTRRLQIKGEQLERVKRYWVEGNPIVALRTASHGFQNALEFDKVVLGGNYQNHYGKGPRTKVEITDAGRAHTILDGMKAFESKYSLYRNTPPAEDVNVLMYGSIPDHREPIAWTREYKGARIFYTSLGGPADFEAEPFKKMIARALFWTARQRGAKSGKR